MSKIIVLIFFLIISCTVTRVKDSSDKPVKTPIIHNSGDSLILNVTAYLKHTERELEKNKKVVTKLRKVLTSPCFEQKLSNYPLIQTNGLSPEQIIQKLHSESVSVRLKMYYKKLSRVNGYTYPNTDMIWMNRKYHNRFGVCSSAQNLGHEIMHKFGFKHDYKPTKRRPMSVPYTVGKIIGECCE